MDKHAYVTGHGLKTQSIAQQNKCTVPDMVKEPLDGCKFLFFSSFLLSFFFPLPPKKKRERKET